MCFGLLFTSLDEILFIILYSNVIDTEDVVIAIIIIMITIIIVITNMIMINIITTTPCYL